MNCIPLYTDKQRFAITVMWIAGFSAGEIARSMPLLVMAPMTRKAVTHMVERQMAKHSFVVRTEMSVGEREAHLLALRQSAQNDGSLPDRLFEVRQ